MSIVAYGLFALAGTLSGVYLAADAMGGAAKKSFSEQATAIFFWLLLLVWLLSTVWATIQKSRVRRAGVSDEELQTLILEEMSVQLSAREWLLPVVIVPVFFLTFFGVFPCFDLCLGKDWGSHYAFATGWVGWFTGLCLVFLKARAQGARRVALACCVFLLTIGAGYLGSVYPVPGLVVVWLIGLVGGGLFGAVYINAQAGALWEDLPWRCRLAGLLRMPTASLLDDFRTLARQGNVPAQLRLGRMCWRGQSVPRDPVEAAKWYAMAANQGNARAQFALCCLHHLAPGPEADDAEACEWCLLAAAQGHELAAILRDHLVLFATPEAIAEGQLRAARFANHPVAAGALPVIGQHGQEDPGRRKTAL